MTWPAGKTILFGVPAARNSGRFDPKFPYGDAPVGNASGAGLVDSSGAPLGYATGGASGAGITDNASAPAGNANGGGGTIVFAETFESRTIGNSVTNLAAESGASGASWKSTSAGTAGVSSLVIASGGYGGSNKSLAFKYGGGDANHDVEQRYIFDTTGSAQAKETWVEIFVFIPANWTIAASGTSAGGNNKFLFVYNDDTGLTNFRDHEMFQIPEGAHAGSAYINMQLKNNTNAAAKYFGNTFNAPHQTTFNWTLTADGQNWYFGKDTAFIDAATDLGTWVGYRFYNKLSSTSSTSDAINRIWKLCSAGPRAGIWDKILDFTNFLDWSTGNNAGGFSNQHFSGGYILGAHNTGYNATTQYLVDNFKISTSDPGWGLT